MRGLPRSSVRALGLLCLVLALVVVSIWSSSVVRAAGEDPTPIVESTPTPSDPGTGEPPAVAVDLGPLQTEVSDLRAELAQRHAEDAAALYALSRTLVALAILAVVLLFLAVARVTVLLIRGR